MGENFLDQLFPAGCTIAPTSLPVPAGPKPLRWYVRCADCLSVSVLEREDTTSQRDNPYREQKRLSDCAASLKGATCGACDGAIEVMGRVHVRHPWLVSGGDLQCKCDERCVDAAGPNCSCQCCGENHGSGIGGFVEVEKTTGLPRITPPKRTEEAKARAKEYRDALEAAKARLDAMPGRAVAERKRAREYVPAEAYALFLTWEGHARALRNAKAGRTHKGRIAKLGQVGI